ncbi:unnamed protein product [Brassica napus]|uniref:(rape) hypothetical protein n=1 Tax=Brassica napus TaxID=3708 RepID=A0A816P682_BRANA|nr:unnamed protein product [Brassica napus]
MSPPAKKFYRSRGKKDQTLDKDMEKDTCNFKSMTYDDPMDFGFGLPENKDKKQNSFKVCSVHSRELHFLFSLYYLAIKLIW